MDEPKTEVALPNLNITLPAETEPKFELVKHEQLTEFYTEVLNDIRDDRKEIDEVLKHFLDMITNDGDATTASKEAVVNLLKLKSESADKKTRVVDLLMRAFLKERDTFPRYLAAHQHNEIKIESSGSKRQLLKAYQKDEINEK